MGGIFEIGAGGMVEVSVKDNDNRNDLQPGIILQLNGYSDPQYVIVKNQGIDPEWKRENGLFT